MKKEKAKELAKILLNYSEGKIVQRFISNKWYDLSELSVNDLISFDLGGNYYPVRIKPEPKLVPFTFEDNLLFRDKWIYKNRKAFKIIAITDCGVEIKNTYLNFIDLLSYSFEDGSPCGKYVE